MPDTDILKHYRQELARIGAEDAQVELDDQFEPQAGTLARLQIGASYWHLLPNRLSELLQSVADRAGGDAVKRAIEQNAALVWHGPSPPGSRDTSF